MASRAGVTVIGTDPIPETTGQKVRRLQAEARTLAFEHISEMLTCARMLAKVAEDVAGGGDAYPPGIRDLARQWVEDLESRIQTGDSIRTKV